MVWRADRAHSRSAERQVDGASRLASFCEANQLLGTPSPESLEQNVEVIGAQLRREQVRTMKGIRLLSDVREKGGDADTHAPRGGVRTEWWIIQSTAVLFYGLITFGVMFGLFEAGTNLQAVHMQSTWAFDANYGPLTRLDWLRWTPYRLIGVDEPGTDVLPAPEVRGLLSLGALFFAAAWLRIFCASVDTNRTVSERSVLVQLVMRAIFVGAQFFFFGAVAAILMIVLFFFFLTCEWLVVASVVKPHEVLPIGTGLVAAYASATTVATGMRTTATKLKQKLREATEMHMKRQFLVYERHVLEKEHFTESEAGHSGFLRGGKGGAGSVITVSDAQVAAVQPSDIFSFFADSKSNVPDDDVAKLDREEFNRIFFTLGWAATKLERDQMFAHCDSHLEDQLLTEEEWASGWDALLSVQVDKAAARLGLMDRNVASAVAVAVGNIVALIVFVVLAASSFTRSSNFVATVQSVVIAGQGVATTLFRQKSKGEDDEEVAKEVARAGGG